MDANGDDRPNATIREEWFRFGVVLAVLYATVTLILLGLLQLDQWVGLLASVVISVAYGISIVIYVQYAR